MLYAILAYHVEAEVMSWTPEQDATVMTGLLAVHDRLNANKLLGPAARLGATADARTLRGPGAGMVIDGPFAETKEQLLGLYVRELRRCRTPRSLSRATCAASIRPPSTRSARSGFISRRSLAGNRERGSGLRLPAVESFRIRKAISFTVPRSRQAQGDQCTRPRVQAGREARSAARRTSSGIGHSNMMCSPARLVAAAAGEFMGMASPPEEQRRIR